MTPIPTRPAASSVVAMGDSRKARGSNTRRHTRVRRRGIGSARTAIMMRSRAAWSVTTGRCASRAIHSTYGCWSESVMLDPLPSLAQAIACALHTHLQRGDANTSQRRHLLITHFFDVFQKERFSQQRVQLIEHSLNKLFIFAGPTRRTIRRVQQHRFFSNEHLFSMCAARRNAPALIHQNPIEPRTEAVTLLVS